MASSHRDAHVDLGYWQPIIRATGIRAVCVRWLNLTRQLIRGIKPGLLEQMLTHARFIDIHVQRVAAPFRLPSRQHIDFVRSAGSPIMQIVAPLSEFEQRDAWHEMKTQLNAFGTTNGSIVPHQLLLCAATTPNPF